jgi:DNA-binding Lrp family transcriptional regulator
MSPSAPRPDRNAAGELLLRHLREAVKAAGGELQPSRSGDARVSLGRRRYEVELKHLREPRRELLQALLADAILRGRTRAGSQERIIAMVGAPLISDAMARSIEEYARAVAPGQPFGYVDERGLVRLFGPGLEKVRREPARRARSRVAIAQPRDLFSDLNQWLLKALVGRALPDDMIAVPREPARSAAELASRAGVSAPAAWRIFAALKADGHIDEEGAVVRARDLLARWRAAALRPQRQVGAVWVMPGRDPLERLRRSLAEQRADERPRAVLGVFSACDALGVGHVRGAPVHLYVEEPDAEQLARLGLALAPRGHAADVQVRVARWPEAVFRAAVRRDSVPVADVIQCWLDVSAEPARGAEQAALIWRRVLGPALAGGEPQP